MSKLHAFVIFLFGAFCLSAHAEHAYSQFGDIKYPPGFTHFDYVNPNAPKQALQDMRTVAPDLELIYESGVYGARPARQ